MITPDVLSVYRFCRVYTAADGMQHLTDVVPFRFEELPDTTEHVVVGQQRIEDIAAIHFQPYGEQAYLLHDVIAGFQPEPILDPTIPLEVGRIIYVPSLRTIEERVFAETRRMAYEGD